MLALLPLRLKLWGVLAIGVATTVLYLYARWRIAKRRADNAWQRAERLEATHNLERDIAIRREKLSERQRKLRAEIALRGGRDYFSGGWGP